MTKTFDMTDIMTPEGKNGIKNVALFCKYVTNSQTAIPLKGQLDRISVTVVRKFSCERRKRLERLTVARSTFYKQQIN